MKKQDDGGSAFPSGTLGGMTLRDWFAGQAIAGLTASSKPSDFKLPPAPPPADVLPGETSIDAAVRVAYRELADLAYALSDLIDCVED